MITFTEYEAYFESLARDFKPISHTAEVQRFAMMDIDDILSDQRGSLNFDDPCMILENPEGELGYKHDKMLDENLGAFHILQRVSRSDSAKKRILMDSTKLIGISIIARIMRQKIQRAKGDNTVPRMLMYFNLSNVKYNKISNVFSDCHGWRFEFNLGKEDPLIYYPEEWYSEDNP